MLRRQRTVLALLKTASTPVSATQFQKYLFLLRAETFIGRDSTFYEFLPYKYGPYSFAAQRELDALAAYGYVESAGSSLILTDLGAKECMQVDTDTVRAVGVIFSKCGSLPLSTLLKDVYNRYPWYAVNSQLEEFVPSTAVKPVQAAIAIYTMGYEDRSIDSFLNKLMMSGIRCIIDVRSNPVSRKYGFAGRVLATLAGRLGISYQHFPALGISSSRRRDARTASEFQRLFGYYEREVLPANRAEMAKLAEVATSGPSVLVCMEKEAVDCHRSRLATALSCVTDLNVVHL